jgi:hypothetical protein
MTDQKGANYVYKQPDSDAYDPHQCRYIFRCFVHDRRPESWHTVVDFQRPPANWPPTVTPNLSPSGNTFSIEFDAGRNDTSPVAWHSHSNDWQHGRHPENGRSADNGFCFQLITPEE